MMIIDDANLIDQVNPFPVSEHPGTWSKPYDFPDKEGVPAIELAQWDTEEPSAGCDAISLDKRSKGYFALCEPGTPNCPMQRELEPTYRFEKDMEYPNDPGNVPVEEVQPKKSMLPIVLFLLLLALIFIAFAKL